MFESSSLFFFWGRLPWMVPRVAFLAGWLISTFIHYPWSSSERLLIETSALRVEVQQAREVALELATRNSSCDWEIWRQRWLLRASLLFDLCLIVWIVRIRFFPSRPRVALASDTGGSSSDTDESSQGGELIAVPAKGKGSWNTWGKTRPSRPSDFKLGKR